MGRKQVFPMTSKQGAQRQAKDLRKVYKDITVNVREIGAGIWGVRMSSKGKRDRFKFD